MNWAHDVFAEKPDVEKMILRDASGCIVCRKQFGRETFVQLPSSEFAEAEEAARRLVVAHHAKTGGFL